MINNFFKKRKRDFIDQLFDRTIKKDRYSRNLYEEEMQEYIVEPLDKKGKGRCAQAAQKLVNVALKEKIPRKDIEVYGVQRNHPFKGGISNHVITKIKGKYYDPTRTQYGKYDKAEFDNIPKEYGKITKLNLRSYEKN